MYTSKIQPISEHPKKSYTQCGVKMIEKVKVCNAVQPPQEAGVGAGLNSLRAETRWHEDNLAVSWHVGWWDFDAGRLISAKDYFFGNLIPSPVCRQHGLIWTSESKISWNLQQVKTIFSSVFFFLCLELVFWIMPVCAFISAKLPKLTLFLIRKLRPLNAENVPI